MYNLKLLNVFFCVPTTSKEGDLNSKEKYILNCAFVCNNAFLMSCGPCGCG